MLDLKPLCRAAALSAIALALSSCGVFSSSKPKTHASKPSQAVKPVRITNINQQEGGRELILQSMDLVGTPYRWGGTTDTGFDCSGMIQYLYKNALNVNLPRTSRQMAEASRSINPSKLKSGDLVFFNTSGRGISHVGLYIGNGEFIHAPSTGSTVRTERLDKPYYAKRLVKAGTFF
ncbi:MAG: C40 family peptidase [Neisseria sp.]|uniref:C40 family peptidase n=1 Tax=Neisseria sp. TaxID=192066 RepID=UPI0026DC37F6|nr:C40 family peptidase [Neisseria sp.]MDO4640138.1 C40 family peptidase [Neisseria sp.]